MNPYLIFLVGLSGSGKTTVGRALASRLGWDFADTDEMVEAAAGHPIPELFRDEGETAFRHREGLALAQVSQLEHVVVATGGGAPTTVEGRAAIGRGFVVWLSIDPEAAAQRLDANPATPDRPLLLGNARARLAALLEERRPMYEKADAIVEVDGLTPDEAARVVEAVWKGALEEGIADRPEPLPGPPQLTIVRPRPVAAYVRTATASYPVIVEDGCLDSLAEICRDEGLKGRAFLFSDEAVASALGPRATAVLHGGGYTVESFAIASGEEHKTLATVSAVYDWLLDHRAERSDFVLCLGGGVVTDLGGFAAATCLRGMAFLHVPTTLLAMVDAAIGGKTGVDHPHGKNMIGAFAQPRAVVIDPELLRTLDRRHLVNGAAELIKHGLILDDALVRDLEAHAEESEAAASAELISRSVAIKAAVVSEDEREEGLRTLLNYGHTLGHAIEAVAGYGPVLHGEAVAVGMRAAGIIAAELRMLSALELERQQRLLTAYGLPDHVTGLDIDAVLDAVLSDKKVRGGSPRWVLLEGIGRASVRDDVPSALVREAAAAVLS